MSKGGSKTSTSKTEIPEPYRRFAENQLAAAGTMMNRPYVNYESPRIADFNEAQKDGFGQMMNLGQRGFGGQLARNSADMAAKQGEFQAGTIAGSDLSAYANPYEDQVVARSMADIDRARQMAMMGVNDQAVSAGAFGGSRAGVQGALTNEAFGKQAADTAAQLRQAGYMNAQNMAGQDISSGIAGAQIRGQAGQQMGQASQLLGNASAAAAADEDRRISAQLQAGGAGQQMDQQNLDLAYRQFLEEQNYPISALSIGQSILGQTPMGSTTRQTVPTQSMLPGLLSAGAKLGAAAITACWVAREIYGIDSPKWIIFRDWLLNENKCPEWFRRLYLAHGEGFAAWVKNKPLLKRVIRAGMDVVVNRELRKAERGLAIA